MNRISSRVLTALVGIPIVAVIVWLGGAAFYLVTFFLAFMALRELEGALQKHAQSTCKENRPISEFLYGALIFILTSVGLFQFGRLSQTALQNVVCSLAALLPLAIGAYAVVFYATTRRVSLQGAAITIFVIYYLALFAFWPLLRALPERGMALMWLLLIGVWASDIAAYYAGRAYGRRKLTPLSPGKTSEGALGGFIAAIAACVIFCVLTRIGFLHGIALGILIGFSAPLGDLVESFWKRELDVKDLGTILPGHGGVLDRCDSLLFTAPFVYGYALWQLV